MNLDHYQHLRRQARGVTRSAADAEDLVQDTLLAALEAGRTEPAWLSGTLRNLAAMQVRGAVRRRHREAAYGEVEQMSRPDEFAGEDVAGTACRSGGVDVRWLHGWPVSLRRVAVLALHGLSAQEIHWVLGISPQAFRQRLSRIRKALEALPADAQAQCLALAHVRDPARRVDLQFGLIRRRLKVALGGGVGLATHDTDGHLLVIHRPDSGHTWAGRGNR